MIINPHYPIASYFAKMIVFTLLAIAASISCIAAKIDRQKVVSQFNPTRYASSNSTPMQIGNGNFAFGDDITGLQTFLPFSTMSSWRWHNFSLPTAASQISPADFTGLDWYVIRFDKYFGNDANNNRWTHGRLVNYDQPNYAEPLISNWLIQNPQQINLGRIGFWFGSNASVVENNLSNKSQTLNLYSGEITSQFTVFGCPVLVPDNCASGLRYCLD